MGVPGGVGVGRAEGMRTAMAQPRCLPPPRGPVGDATEAGVPGLGASLPQLLTLAKKKSSCLIHSPSRLGGGSLKSAVEREDNLVTNAP